MKFRIEEDSLGKVRVPRNALWGAQTQRAIDNFPISGISMNFPFTNTFISMLGYVKDAAARANKKYVNMLKQTGGQFGVYIEENNAKGQAEYFKTRGKAEDLTNYSLTILKQYGGF